MKHVGCRAKINVRADGFPIWDATATFTSTANIPTKVEFSTATQSYTMKDNAPLAENITFNPGEYENNFSINHPNMYLYGPTDNSFYYFLPTTNGANLKLTLTGGTAYRLPLNGRSVTFPALSSMEPNGSYLLTMKLHYNYFYLFSDGTIGQKTDANFSSKTPIAVVVSRSKRIAAALNDINTSDISNYKWGKDNTTTTTTAGSPSYLSDLNGYDLTYSTTYSTDGIVKGNDATNYPAFYAAAHYNPGVTVTGANVGKWYLPSIGEWNLFFKNLVFLSDRNLDNVKSLDYATLYPETYAIKMTHVADYTPGAYYYWYYISSSENSLNEFYSYCEKVQINNFYSYIPPSIPSMHFVKKLFKSSTTSVGQSDNPVLLIRPFVHY